MRKFRTKTHSIDLLFTISLFFVFTITALLVMIAGANLYEKTVRQTSKDYSVFTSLAYLEQKVKRYDTSGGVSIISENGQDILCLHETIDGTAYTTYIYTQNGQLMELFWKDGSSPDFAGGTALMDSGTLSLKETGLQNLELELSDEEGVLQTLNLHLKSKEE